jgi:hypothetical protein
MLALDLGGDGGNQACQQDLQGAGWVVCGSEDKIKHAL